MTGSNFEKSFLINENKKLKKDLQKHQEIERIYKIENENFLGNCKLKNEKTRLRKLILILQKSEHFYKTQYENLKIKNASLERDLRDQRRKYQALENIKEKLVSQHNEELKKKESEKLCEDQIKIQLRKNLTDVQVEAKTLSHKLSAAKKSKKDAEKKIDVLEQNTKAYIRDGRKMKKKIALYDQSLNSSLNCTNSFTSHSPTVAAFASHSTAILTPSPSPPKTYPQTTTLDISDDLYTFYDNNKEGVTRIMRKITEKRPDVNINYKTMNKFIYGLQLYLNKEKGIQSSITEDLSKPPPMNPSETKDLYNKQIKWKIEKIKPLIESGEFTLVRTLFKHIETATLELRFQESLL